MSNKPFQYNFETANLSDLIDLREKMYQDLTETAFKSFQSKLSESVRFYLNLKADHPIQWGTVNKFTVNGLEGFVTVAGFIMPIIGAEMKISDTEVVTITPDNYNNFKNLVRFVVPIKLLENGTRLELSNFIRDLTAITGIASEADLQQLLKEYYFGDMESLTSHSNYNTLLDKLTKPKEFDGFDISGLNDNQIRQLHLLNHVKSETKN